MSFVNATWNGVKTTLPQRAPATDTISYAGYRFPSNVISYAVWSYYRFPARFKSGSFCDTQTS
jgi:hypothetical protein